MKKAPNSKKITVDRASKDKGTTVYPCQTCALGFSDHTTFQGFLINAYKCWTQEVFNLWPAHYYPNCKTLMISGFTKAHYVKQCKVIV